MGWSGDDKCFPLAQPPQECEETSLKLCYPIPSSIKSQDLKPHLKGCLLGIQNSSNLKAISYNIKMLQNTMIMRQRFTIRVPIINFDILK